MENMHIREGEGGGLTVLELPGVELVRRLGPGARQLVRVRLALVALYVALRLMLLLLLPLLTSTRRYALQRLRTEYLSFFVQIKMRESVF